jgi:hypothetical protein
VAIELEVAGALAAGEAFPDGDLTPREMMGELRIRPGVAVAPVPSRADVLV